MSSELPVAFRISISSYYGRSFSLVVRDDKLIYNSTRPECKTVRDPSADDWQRFWKKTVNLKIWLWDKQYIDRSRSDGSHWSVNLEVGKLKLMTYGSNSYPENFNEFIQAVRELIPGLELSSN